MLVSRSRVLVSGRAHAVQRPGAFMKARSVGHTSKTEAIVAEGGWAARKARAMAFVDKYPLRLSCGILCTKGFVCDTLAQRAVAGKSADEQDWRRTLIMAAYGGLCEAPLAFLFYSNIFPVMFGAARTITAVCQMLLVENLFLW